MPMIPNMRGKSWAMLQSLFQNWLVRSFPPESTPDSETVMLMWQAWLQSHEITKQAFTKPSPPIESEPMVWWWDDCADI